MKPSSASQQQIVWREWDELDDTAVGYLPVNHPADGFYAYAECANGDEWSLISAVKLNVLPRNKK